GDQLEAKVDAKLYAGGPYTQAKTTFKTRLEPKQFKPDNSAFAGFSFGQDKKLPDSQSIAENEKVLDEQGEVENNLRLPEDSKIIYGEVQVEGVVASARGKSVANTASAVFAARDRFVGLRTPNWLQHAGKA